MFIFTYNDYLDCMENQKLQKALYIENKRNRARQNNREKEKQENQQDEQIDEIIETLVERKEEIANFINDFFKTVPWQITKDTIQKYQKLSYEQMIIYKIKEKQVYFFIKLQKEPNYYIAYHILTECTNFIKNWKIQHLHYVQAPIIVPIVIYTGRKEWSKKINLDFRYTKFQDNYINLSYNFVNLHQYKPIELIRNKSLISNVSILKMPIHISIKRQILQTLKNQTEEIDICLKIKALERNLINK